MSPISDAGPVPSLVQVASLTPAPWNPRTISEPRFKNLCASLEADPDFLWRRPLLANIDGIVMAGNMRLRAAQHLGWTDIPAIVEDVPDVLAKERGLKDNGSWGDWQEDELAAMLWELSQENADLTLVGFDDKELKQLLDSVGGTDVPPDPREYDESVENEVKWIVCPACAHRWPA